ncbi:MAG: hypothetical protein IKQ47_08950 [Prevotella sp.]|nr:hypothetical protein [Prevotella sp.]MBR4269889.1 hypothetical protein [Prevotella sp.]
MKNNIVKNIAEERNISFIDLAPFDFAEDDVAFPIVKVQRLLSALRDECIPILGGDILIVEHNELDSICCSWSCEIIKPFSQFVEYSYNKTKQYIDNYIQLNKEKLNSVYVNIVVFSASDN